MNRTPDGIRRVAILVSSLDQASADAVLEQLDPAQVQQVRQLMVEMETIDQKEQRRIIDEFFRAGSRKPPSQEYPAGIELDGRLAQQLSMPPRDAAGPSQPRLPADTRPFRFLHETEADKLAQVLGNERPQTIALVLSHLPADQAGNVLARLPGDLQVDVIHRLVELEETDPEILREVEHALAARLSRQVHMRRRRVAGIKALTGIIEASEGPIAVQILDNLTTHDRELAERLSPPAIQFDDLSEFDDAALGVLFRTAQPALVMTALVGASPALVNRILRRFPPAGADAVRRKLDHPGPLRLSDVDGGRQQIADLARRLAMEGRIQLPQNIPVSVS